MVPFRVNILKESQTVFYYWCVDYYTMADTAN